MIVESSIAVALLSSLYFVFRRRYNALALLVTALILNFALKFIFFELSYTGMPDTAVTIAFAIAPYFGYLGWIYAFIVFLYSVSKQGVLNPVASAFIATGLYLWFEKFRRKVEDEELEVGRKIFHAAAGILIYFLSILWPKFTLAFCILAILGVIILNLIDIPFVKEIALKMTRPHEKFIGIGAINFLAGVMLATWFSKQWVVLIMAISDGLSTIFGRIFGTAKIVRNKTIEGTAIGFLTALAIAKHYSSHPWIIAVAYTLAELFAPIDDNFFVPLVLVPLSLFLD